MGKLIFSCGCQFQIDGEEDIIVEDERFVMPSGINLDIYNINENCKKTWDLLATGRTKGVFQLESHLGKDWSANIRPSNLEHLSGVVSNIRPGCLRAMSGEPPKSMTQRYSDRKNGLEQVEYLNENLKSSLESTYGVLCYQEQSTKIAAEIAGFNMQQAEMLRKSIGKKKADMMKELEKTFVDGCIKVGKVSEKQAIEIFDWIKQSQRYSFNKSHGISYGKTSYWTAYLKAHFPLQFYCSYLYGARWKQETHREVAEIVNDAKLFGVSIFPPRFKDNRDKPYIHNNFVFFGLGDVKQIGGSSLNKIQKNIAEISKNIGKSIEDWDWIDYLVCFSDSISTTANKAIISCGSLDYLNKSRSSMLYELNIWNSLTLKEKSYIIEYRKDSNILYELLKFCAKPKKEGGGCSNRNRVEMVESLCFSLKNPPHSLNDTADFISCVETEYLGISVSCSKVDSCEDAIMANASCFEVANNKCDSYIVIAVEINVVKEIKTKKGKEPGKLMAFIEASDNSGSLTNLVVFPDIYKSYSEFLKEGNTVLLRCEKNKKSIVVQKVAQI
jgi:DNA polymerase-3 subunit alpha